MNDNFWGTIPAAASMSTPYSILVNQGNILDKLTAGDISGYAQKTSSSGDFTIEFFLFVKNLNSYKYNLLRVQHGVGLYPLTLRPVGNVQINCADEENFKYELKNILSSEGTIKIIQALLAQLRDDSDDIPF